VTLTGATFDETITFAEWLLVMRKCVRVKEAIQWVIGDGINFAFRQFVEGAPNRGERKLYLMRYTEALDSLPYEPRSLHDFAYVARHVDSSIRIEELSFRHHQLVAAFDQKKQKKYLSVAAKNKFSVADLNEYIRDNEAEVDNDHDGPVTKPGALEWANRLALWCQQQDLSDWTRERRTVVKRDLAPVVEFYQRL